MLHLEHLAKVYGDRIVLRDVNASFAAGSISLLAGNNGAGKSTLLRIVAGLARATSGTVRFADPAPVTAYLGHATFLYPGLSALENLAFWNGVHELRLSRHELLGLLDHVGLAAHAHERAGIFSRGMAQRLNLARVLMLQADLLLLDEPGTGLDAPLADRILRLHKGRLTEESPGVPPAATGESAARQTAPTEEAAC